MKTSKLFKFRRTLKIVEFLAGIIAAVSFFLVIGSVGTIDYNVEMGIMLSKAEETAIWVRAFVSEAVWAVSMGAIMATERMIDEVNRELNRRKKIRKQKLAEQKAIQQGIQKGKVIPLPQRNVI